jgi:hypothetical protein
MALLYLDECLAGSLPALIRALGHDVLGTIAAGRRSRPDFDQLLYAHQQRRILVTHNVPDFAVLHGAWLAWGNDWMGRAAPQHAGIIGLERRKPPDLASILGTFLSGNRYYANEMYRWTFAHGWQTRHGHHWV